MLGSLRESWSNLDYLICLVVWAAMVYFGSTQIHCAHANECGIFDMWLFAVISASLIPAAIFSTVLISIFTPKKK